MGKTKWAAFPKLFWLSEIYILSPFLLTSGTVSRTSLWKILPLLKRVILCGENTLQCCGKESIWRQHSHGTTSLWRSEWVHYQNPRSNSAPLSLPQDFVHLLILQALTHVNTPARFLAQDDTAGPEDGLQLTRTTCWRSDIQVRDFPPFWGKSHPLGMDGWKSSVNSAWSTLASEWAIWVSLATFTQFSV